MEAAEGWKDVQGEDRWGNKKKTLNWGQEGKGNKQEHYIYITGFCAGALMWNDVHQKAHTGNTHQDNYEN